MVHCPERWPETPLDFYYFTNFLFYLGQITQTQAFKSYPDVIDRFGLIYPNSFKNLYPFFPL